MSFNNREEDVQAVKNLYIGEEYCYNTFNEGGCLVRRSEDNQWELFELPLYGMSKPMLFGCYAEDELLEMINEGYSWS